MMTQTKTPEWSGLAPAVDAHISFWSRADRTIKLAQRWYDERHHADFNGWISTPEGQTWSHFASSYGVPGPDGVPVHDILVYDGDTISGREQMSADTTGLLKGALLAIHEHQMLTKGVTHYVSAEVVDEVNTAAALAQNEPLFPLDVFTPHGFAVLEQAVPFPDLDPATGGDHPTLEVHIRAIGWTTIPNIGTTDPDDRTLKPGVMLFLYTTRDDFRNGYYRSTLDAGLEPPYDPDEVRDGFVPIEVISWQFGRDWDTRSYAAGHIVGTVPTPVGMQRRWFYAFQRLMWQTIIVPHRADNPSRQLRRQWERDAARKELLDYTTLRLRRVVDPLYKPGGETGTGVPLDHRVLVRPHWRFQYLPGSGLPARDIHGAQIPESHRWVFVEAHWRGDDSLPIGAMEWATSVVR